MIERHIVSVSDFLEALQADQETNPGTVWFRGHADAKWQLLPGFMRSAAETSETTLLNRFRQSAAMLADRRPLSSFDWTFLMQHYGVPTRLLDWSESPLISMYFAVEDWATRPDIDAALWCLWPTSLNKHANIVDKIEGQYIPSFEDEELQAYSTDSLRQNTRIELFPVATIATRNNAQIQAQMGTFTIHHNKKVAIEAVGDGAHVAKYVIPHDAKERLAGELKLLGMTLDSGGRSSLTWSQSFQSSPDTNKSMNALRFNFSNSATPSNLPYQFLRPSTARRCGTNN